MNFGVLRIHSRMPMYSTYSEKRLISKKSKTENIEVDFELEKTAVFNNQQVPLSYLKGQVGV